jgi:DNA-binding ferritin-like protein (Dps family)
MKKQETISILNDVIEFLEMEAQEANNNGYEDYGNTLANYVEKLTQHRKELENGNVHP